MRSSEMCCLNRGNVCRVKYLDAYVLTLYYAWGRLYGKVEQRVTESVMRGHSLIGKPAFALVPDVTPTIGPYFTDYEFVLTQAEFNLLESAMTMFLGEVSTTQQRSLPLTPVVLDTKVPD